MQVYHERLAAPITTWLLALVLVAIFGSMLWGGLSLILGVSLATGTTSYAVLLVFCAALLVNWGRAKINVSDIELRAGSRVLPLSLAADVIALDRAASREMRGPRADPAAYLLVRPYLPRAVYVSVRPGQLAEPYWLIGTRRPAELARVIGAARARLQVGS